MNKGLLKDEKMISIVKDGLEDTALILNYLETLLVRIDEEIDSRNIVILKYQLKSLELKMDIINYKISKYMGSRGDEQIIFS